MIDLLSSKEQKIKKEEKEVKSIDHYLSNKLIPKEFLSLISILSLEELIFLKLDTVSSSLNGRVLSLKLFYVMKYIVIHSILKYSVEYIPENSSIYSLMGVSKYIIEMFLNKLESKRVM